ncbi:ABC transporter substrate-binding protein [Allostreptomyces psammosilenae]|uniref:Multiple sugar transport system substrate-binding protein n=1 Tax=Allostreptomyces psammosilenae TaxID=1892865 RepID=A0A852ZR87_9ACTN|nr:extracellular solute-binding protein [Allostreptomyces psammosilenae]NYI04889.1 multiple sugar transport system substrate-binding protein [Allostreptomyces psammosilenae]
MRPRILSSTPAARRRIRSAGAGLAAIVVLGATAACGGGSGSDDGRVTLRYSWWGNADRAELMQQAIDLFEQQNPNIDVQPTFSEYEAYWQKLATESAGGGAPDVMQMDVSYLREYSDKNVLLDLASGEAAANLNTDDFRGGLATAGEIDGQLFGVPVGGNTFTLVYNPAAFEEAGAPAPEAGWSWEQFWQTYETFGPDAEVKAGADYTGIIWVLELQLRQQGASLFTEEGELGFTREQFKEYLEQGERLRQDGLAVDPQKIVEVKPISPLGSGLDASEFTWDNFLVRFAGETDAELELAPVPTFDPANTGQYLKPSLMLSASARTEHPAEAAKLIDFLINDVEAGKILGANRGLPATNAQFEAVELEGVDAAVAAYEESVADALQPAPPVPPAGAGSIEALLLRVTEDLSFGEISVDEAVDQFFSEAEDILAR